MDISRGMRCKEDVQGQAPGCVLSAAGSAGHFMRVFRAILTSLEFFWPVFKGLQRISACRNSLFFHDKAALGQAAESGRFYRTANKRCFSPGFYEPAFF
jgi:hypothetical protein